MAGLFLLGFARGDYFATRSLASEVPIELNTVTIWLADDEMKNLSGLLAQFCRAVEVGSPGEPVLTWIV